MKLNTLLCVALLTSTTLAQTQNTKPPGRTKPPTQQTQKNTAQQFPFDDARHMTVIVMLVPPNSLPIPHGSGVWIGKQGYIVTCWHVIQDAPDLVQVGLEEEPYVNEGIPNISITGVVRLIAEVKVVAHDENTDIAILKSPITPDQVLNHFQPMVTTEGPGFHPITPQSRLFAEGACLNPKFPPRGETLLLTGFPIPQSTPVTMIFQTAVATGFTSRPAKDTSPPSTGLRLMLSAVTNPGNSGGPLFDAHGSVVGLLEGNLLAPVATVQFGSAICSWMHLDASGHPARDASGNVIPPVAQPCMQNSGISFAVPARFIDELAKKNNINLE